VKGGHSCNTKKVSAGACSPIEPRLPYLPFKSTSAPTVVANHLVASFRFNHLGGKGNSGDTTTDIFEEITIITLADNVSEAKVADAVFGRAQADKIQQVTVALNFK